MKPIPFAPFAAAGAIALSAGCATPPPPPPPPPPPVYMTTSALGTELTANVVGTAATEDDRPMLDAFVLAVRNEMQVRGYRLDAEEPEVIVELKASERVLDRSGRNVTLEGTFSAAATMPARRNLKIAADTFAVQSEQSLGEDAARADLVRIAMPRVHRWVGTNVLPADTGMTAVNVQLVGGELDPSEDPRVVAAFVQAAIDTDGTLRVRELSRDAEARRYKFRIVHVTGKFPPGGYLSAILASHPELPLTPLR